MTSSRSTAPSRKRADRPTLGRRHRLDRREPVDEDAVALVGGHAAGAGVGLGDEPLVLERGHVVADRGGADPEGVPLDERARADGLVGRDVVLDDGAQHGQPTVLDHARLLASERRWHSRRTSAKSRGHARHCSSRERRSPAARRPATPRARWSTAPHGVRRRRRQEERDERPLRPRRARLRPARPASPARRGGRGRGRARRRVRRHGLVRRGRRHRRRRTDGWAVVLEDRHGVRRPFLLRAAAFLLDGARGHPGASRRRPRRAAPPRTASGSIAVADLRAAGGARVADLGRGPCTTPSSSRRSGATTCASRASSSSRCTAPTTCSALVREFAPGPGRRLGVLLDHLVPGSKETRIAEEVRRAHGAHVTVLGHPYVDVWQAIRPQVLGIDAWPVVPKGQPWKQGVLAAAGTAVRHARRRRRRVALAARARALLRRPRAEPARPGRGAHRHRHRS